MPMDAITEEPRAATRARNGPPSLVNTPFGVTGAGSAGRSPAAAPQQARPSCAVWEACSQCTAVNLGQVTSDIPTVPAQKEDARQEFPVLFQRDSTSGELQGSGAEERATPPPEPPVVANARPMRLPRTNSVAGMEPQASRESHVSLFQAKKEAPPSPFERVASLGREKSIASPTSGLLPLSRGSAAAARTPRTSGSSCPCVERAFSPPRGGAAPGETPPLGGPPPHKAGRSGSGFHELCHNLGVELPTTSGSSNTGSASDLIREQCRQQLLAKQKSGSLGKEGVEPGALPARPRGKRVSVDSASSREAVDILPSRRLLSLGTTKPVPVVGFAQSPGRPEGTRNGPAPTGQDQVADLRRDVQTVMEQVSELTRLVLQQSQEARPYQSGLLSPQERGGEAAAVTLKALDGSPTDPGSSPLGPAQPEEELGAEEEALLPAADATKAVEQLRQLVKQHRLAAPGQHREALPEGVMAVLRAGVGAGCAAAREAVMAAPGSPLARRARAVSLATDWPRVVEEVGLAEHQHGAVLAWRAELCAKLQAQQGRRSYLLEQAISALPAANERAWYNRQTGYLANTDTARHLIDTMDGLRDNLRKEQSLVAVATVAFLGRVLMPGQAAVLMAAAWPAHGDCLAFANALLSSLDPNNQEHEWERHADLSELQEPEFSVDAILDEELEKCSIGSDD